MEISFLALSDIYNFLRCCLKPNFQIHIDYLSQFIHIHSLLRDFIQNNQQPKSTFHNLYLFLVQQQSTLGPRKFCQLLQSTTAIVIQHVLIKLRRNQIDQGVLYLTYFQRTCQKYFSVPIKILVDFSFALSHFVKQTYNLIEGYLSSIKSYLRILSKSSRHEQNIQSFKILLSLFQGIFLYNTEHFSKSKSIFSQMLSVLTLKIHEQKSKKKTLPLLTINLFILATFFISLTYKKLGMNDLSAYNLTQSYYFAIEHLPNSTIFIQMFQLDNFTSQKAQVKLSRVQNKIERIKSLYSNSNPKKNQFVISQNKKSVLLKKQNVDLVQISIPIVQCELNNIMIVEQKARGQLKLRTINQLNKLTYNKSLKIQNFQKEIKIFQTSKQQFKDIFKIQEHKQTLAQIQKAKQTLKKQIVSKIWSVADKLKQTKKIQSYLHTFINAINYYSTNRFYRFLYSQVGIMGHLAIFKFIRKYKSNLQRLHIKKIILKEVKHQLQFLAHRITKQKYIKVYSIMRGSSVDDFIEVSEQTFQNLRSQPLEYYFDIRNNKLYHFKNYIQSLQWGVKLRVQLFAFKLKQKLLKIKGLLKYSRHYISVSFGLHKSNIQYTLFVISKKISQTQYLHQIFRVDNSHFINPDYNIIIRKSQINCNSQVERHQINQILVSSLLQFKLKHKSLLIKLQKRLRIKLALNKSLKLREKNQIMTSIIGSNLFTLVINSNTKTFFIQNLNKNYPSQIIKGVGYLNLAFINKLRPQLASNQDCLFQLSLIKKYFRLKQFGQRMILRSKELILNSNFSAKLKKSLCFAKTMKQILYRGKFVDVKAMYMLTIQNFQVYPRPYLLRVFNLESKSLYSFDFQKLIFMPQKIFLQSNLARINTILDIQGYKTGNILPEGIKLMVKNKRTNSKSTILSNYSFKHEILDEVQKQNPSRSRISYHIQTRESLIVSRNKKNSINYKMRHKSALKQKDILLIKKWIQDSKQSCLISQSSDSSQS